MPRAILTFKLPQEESELQDALNGSKWRWILQGLEQTLKHYEGSPTSIRELLNQMVCDNDLILFD